MKKRILILSVIIFQVFTFNLASAQGNPPPAPTVTVTLSTIGGTNGIFDVGKAIQKFGGWLLLIAGALSVVMIIVGGVRYMVSMGNSQQTEGAKKTLMYAVGGLIIVLLSAGIVKLVTVFFGGGNPVSRVTTTTTTTTRPSSVYPQWLTDKIRSGSALGSATCQYNGNTVYNVHINTTVHDAYTAALYNSTGAFICYTSGGISGQGDLTRCPGFNPGACSTYVRPPTAQVAPEVWVSTTAGRTYKLSSVNLLGEYDGAGKLLRSIDIKNNTQKDLSTFVGKSINFSGATVTEQVQIVCVTTPCDPMVVTRFRLDTISIK